MTVTTSLDSLTPADGYRTIEDFFDVHLHRNVKLFSARNPVFEESIHEFLHRNQMQIARETGGSILFRIVSENNEIQRDGLIPATHSAGDYPFLRYRQYVPDKQWLLIIGVDALSLPCLAAHRLTEFSPVMIIEPDMAFLISYLLTHSYDSFLQLRQVYWFWGGQAFEQCLSDIDSHLEPYFITTQAFFPIVSRRFIEGRADLPIQQFTSTFQTKFAAKIKEIQSITDSFLSHYQNRPADNTQTVMIVEPSASCWMMIAEGLAWGFNQIGLRTVNHKVPYIHSSVTVHQMLQLLLEIRRMRPDILVAISHPSDLLVHGIGKVPIPRFAWYVDEPNHLMQFRHGPFDHIFYVWKDFAASLRTRGGHLAGELPIGGNPITYIRKNELACEVGFVGTVKNTNPIREKIPQSLLQQIDTVTDARLAEIKTPFSSLFKRFGLNANDLTALINILGPFIRKLEMNDKQVLLFFLDLECIRKRRTGLLCALHDYDLKIFGNPDWEELLRDTPIRHAFQHRGLISDECYNFYHTAVISINIHPLFPHDGPMSRDMDIPMCDGFLLSDLHLHAGERMQEFFAPETEITLYKTAADLTEKIGYYLDHAEERKSITQAAKKRIMKDHSYIQRARRILAYQQNLSTSLPIV
ncbi:MAG: glycosyltransferase family 1 protein [Candidatus Omnitrophota bacterium]|jgi:hypothetical protein|nr:MAG: glycosyltransferase family 1 protein [Candidatus Omnitrophota bacterium]